MPAAPHRLVLFGHPVAHSLSPRIQRLFAAQRGARLDYRLVDVAPADFAAAVHAFFAAGGHGANVTVPHKGAAFALAASPTAAARRAGAVNVLWPDSGGLRGDNSDGRGLVADLSRRGLQLGGRRLLLLGAGGAARGVAGPLLDAGIAELLIANRTPARAASLAADFGATAVALADLARIGRVDLVLNATSAGHAGARLALPPGLVDARSTCCDLSYGAAAAPFLAWASSAGAGRAFDGLGMLVETAAGSYARWFGVRPDTAPVHAALGADDR